VDKNLWTDGLGQPADLAATPPWAAAAGAAAAVLDTHLHTLHQKKIFNLIKNVTHFTEFPKSTCHPSPT
jgi:hypothetical protein